MLTRGVLRIFRLHLRMCNWISSISHEWDARRRRLCTLHCPRRRLQFHVNLGIAVLHNLFLLWSFLLQDVASYGIAYQMLAIYFAGGYSLCNGLRLCVWRLQADLAALLNAQLAYESSLKESKGSQAELRSGGERTEKILLTLGIVTGLSVPAFVFLILLAHPCLPPFLGSLLFTYSASSRTCSWRTSSTGSSSTSSTSSSSWGLYAAISLFDFWTHLDMVLPMTFSMFSLFALTIAVLQDYVDLVERDLGKAGNFPGTPSALLAYRRLQLLEKQVNVCFRHFYFPLFLSGMTALLVFCMHSTVKLPGKIPMPGFSYFPLVVINGIVSLLVMNTKAANVYEHSLRLKATLRTPPLGGGASGGGALRGGASSGSSSFPIRRKHWTLKMAQSLPPLKIHFGMNFVDKVTPLLMINFSVNQVVSLLLIQSD